MPIQNYTDLKASVANWMNRGDVNVTDRVPDFIRSAESQIAIDFRLRQQLAIAQLNTTVGFNGIALPDDFLEFDSVSIDGQPLEEVSLADIMRWKYSGTARHYAVAGNQMTLSVQAGTVYPVDVTYFQRFTPLEVNPTNGLLTNYPDVYLFAALMSGFRFVMNEAAAAQWQGQYIALAARLHAADVKARYSGSNLRVRAR